MTAAHPERTSRSVSGFSLLAPMIILTAFTACAAASASDVRDFTSDGCSLFPDKAIGERTNWCDCCFAHDIAYWQGGTDEERKAADAALHDCVLKRTGNKALAESVYLSVRAGGHPAFPTWYRWGYGWSYGRGYRPLTDDEQAQIREALTTYQAAHPEGYCDKK